MMVQDYCTKILAHYMDTLHVEVPMDDLSTILKSAKYALLIIRLPTVLAAAEGKGKFGV